MRRTWGRQSRRKRSIAHWSSPLCVEALENRLALSHAPLDVSHDSMAYAPAQHTSMAAGRDYAEVGYAQADMGHGSYGSQPNGASSRDNMFRGSDSAFSSNYVSSYGDASRGMPPSMHAMPVVQPRYITVVIVEFTYTPEYIVFAQPPSLPSVAAPRPKAEPQIARLSSVSDDGEAMPGGPSGQARANAVQAIRSPQAGDEGIASSIAAASHSIVAPQAGPVVTFGDMGSGRPRTEAVPTSPFDLAAPGHIDSRAFQADDAAGGPDETAPVPNAPSEPVVNASADAGAEVTLAAAKDSPFALGDLSRAALMANVTMSVEAVDQAFDAVMREVEKIGGDLVSWFDELDVPTWAAATAAGVVLGFGGQCYLRRRGTASGDESLEEESSSWLFTRLQTPPGRI